LAISKWYCFDIILESYYPYLFLLLKPKFSGSTALHVAAINHHVDVVALLLAFGADQKVCNAFKRSAKQEGIIHSIKLITFRFFHFH
jgi:hypothetical protein